MSATFAFIESIARCSTGHWCDIPVIDMHLHFVDFLQQSDLFAGKAGAKGLLKTMEEGNIAKNVVFGLPVKKKWEFFEPRAPHYYLDDNSRCTYYNATDELVASQYAQLSEQNQAKIAPTLVGFDPTDQLAIEYVKYMFEKYPFWKGIGEVLLRHDDLTNLTIGETARANHPAMGPIYDFCADRGLPICIHQNSTSVASSVSSVAPKDYVYLHELKEALDREKKPLLIWAHCGVSRRVQHADYHHMVRDMLSCYGHLYVDVSWVCYENAVCDPEHPGVPKQSWVDLIADFPERFMLGSDLCGHFSTKEEPYQHGKTMARYNGLLTALAQRSPELAQQVAYGNAARLYFGER